MHFGSSIVVGLCNLGGLPKEMLWVESGVA